MDSMELCTSVGFLFAVAAAVLRVSSSIVELSRSSVWGGAAVLAPPGRASPTIVGILWTMVALAVPDAEDGCDPARTQDGLQRASSRPHRLPSRALERVSVS